MIVHSRVDFRLIHGQVITQWITRLNVSRIITVDDGLAGDEFLKEVFMMAAPKGVGIRIVCSEEAVRMQREGQFDDVRCLILFKTVDGLNHALQKGLVLSEVQIGGLGGGPGRKAVHNAITLDQHDVKVLKRLQDQGIRIYFQTTPDYDMAELDVILKKWENRG